MKNYLKLALLSAAHFCLGILSGAFGWLLQLVIVSASGIFLLGLCYFMISRKWGIAVLAVAPLYIVIVPMSILLDSYQTFPIWITGLIVCSLTIMFLQFKVNLYLASAVLIFLIVFSRLFVLPNTISYLGMDQNFRQYKIDNLRIVDHENRIVSANEIRNKILLLDVWSTACAPCIKKFPDLQRIKEKFGIYSDIAVIALNMPLYKDEIRKSSKYTEQFSFLKYFLVDEIQSKKLGVEAVPFVLIFDKNLNCRYAGGFNDEWNVYIGNVERILNKIRVEE